MISKIKDLTKRAIERVGEDVKVIYDKDPAAKNILSLTIQPATVPMAETL